MYIVTYYEQNLLFLHPDHLCFDQTCDNIKLMVWGDHLCLT